MHTQLEQRFLQLRAPRLFRPFHSVNMSFSGFKKLVPDTAPKRKSGPSVLAAAIGGGTATSEPDAIATGPRVIKVENPFLAGRSEDQETETSAKQAAVPSDAQQLLAEMAASARPGGMARGARSTREPSGKPAASKPARLQGSEADALRAALFAHKSAPASDQALPLLIAAKGKRGARLTGPDALRQDLACLAEPEADAKASAVTVESIEGFGAAMLRGMGASEALLEGKEGNRAYALNPNAGRAGIGAKVNNLEALDKAIAASRRKKYRPGQASAPSIQEALAAVEAQAKAESAGGAAKAAAQKAKLQLASSARVKPRFAELQLGKVVRACASRDPAAKPVLGVIEQLENVPGLEAMVIRVEEASAPPSVDPVAPLAEGLHPDIAGAQQAVLDAAAGTRTVKVQKAGAEVMRACDLNDAEAAAAFLLSVASKKVLAAQAQAEVVERRVVTARAAEVAEQAARAAADAQIEEKRAADQAAGHAAEIMCDSDEDGGGAVEMRASPRAAEQSSRPHAAAAEHRPRSSHHSSSSRHRERDHRRRSRSREPRRRSRERSSYRRRSSRSRSPRDRSRSDRHRSQRHESDSRSRHHHRSSRR